MVEVVSIVDERLGRSSHVIGLGDGTALVIDPARCPGDWSAATGALLVTR